MIEAVDLSENMWQAPHLPIAQELTAFYLHILLQIHDSIHLAESQN